MILIQTPELPTLKLFDSEAASEIFSSPPKLIDLHRKNILPQLHSLLLNGGGKRIFFVQNKRKVKERNTK
jgi:hypothetical protein